MFSPVVFPLPASVPLVPLAAAAPAAGAGAAGGEAAAGMSAGAVVGLTVGVATVVVVGGWALGEYLGAWDVDGKKGLFGQTPSKDAANSLHHGVEIVATGVQHATHAVAHFFHL